MSLERDLQSKIAVVFPDAIAIAASGVEGFSATVIDTKGFRDFTVAVSPELLLEDGDEMYLVAEDSEDGITFADVPYYKTLPTRNIPGNGINGQPLFNPIAPYVFTCGIDNARRYVRIGINCITLKSQRSITFHFGVIMQSENQCFIAYESPLAVPGDNLP